MANSNNVTLAIERIWEAGLSINNLDKVDSFLSKEKLSKSSDPCSNCGSSLNNYSSCAICPSCGNRECE